MVRVMTAFMTTIMIMIITMTSTTATATATATTKNEKKFRVFREEDDCDSEPDNFD